MRPRRKSVVIARTQIRASLRGLGLSLRDDSDDSASNSSSKISQSRSPSHSPAAKRSRIDAISNAPSGVVPTQAQSQASESVSSTMRPNEQTRQRRRKANRTGFDRPTSNVNQVPLNAPNANPPQPSTSTSAMAAASTSAATTTTTKKPLKRPNEMRAKRGETENKDLEQFTVVMTLNQFLRDEKVFPDKQRLTDLIERVVANSSRMFKLASLYVLFILNRLVDNGSDVEIRREFLAKFNANKYFRALKKTPLHTPAYILDNEFRDFLIENDIETKLDLDNANQVLKFAIEQYDRNAKLIVKTHMRRYMRRYFKNLGATKHQINKIMNYLCDRNSTCRPNANLLNRYLEELKPLVPPQVVQPQRRRRQTPPRRGPQSGRGRRRGRQQRQQRQRGRRGRQQQPLPVPRGWLFETHSKFDWYKYVYELLNLQRVIHAHNATNPHRNWSSFVAVPQSSNAKHHARFDTDGFVLLTNLLYEAGTGQKIPVQRDPWTHAQHNAFWRRFVNLDKINKPSQQFDFSFTTDGCSAHLKMIRRSRNVNTNTNNNNNNDDAVPNPEQPIRAANHSTCLRFRTN
ncbi:uncharacterized protein LOC116347862 [Contarinia nasturtii]|uniref:uncharacterized protein LOC116347862 n=1 Tax=Contarinia nasturtii TaxID=265458 RepID=UPI0012D372B8|nr:uncharacterized protein LOC116347862 [Contarinia nasturtii]XP_031634473.1 uncharacterized protein LOC116347862 [Contarinia nasturtii]XP_031634474.1 uncharacterized protein LOC116347862 [Contarinia nasturtii]XP_031634475.1 uncharacterized protein LOC116347862 [Contarinia nasturtii]XP_031634476.1 uncharacterized protein LOC116347862 [Contarinia nasturtii]XP_031634477.1 uncharacterized protein LOC116347862 [Contarinia nasturtii]XP_031634478.1 uncharacterized protein LOC116347862 [Contarinia n